VSSGALNRLILGSFGEQLKWTKSGGMQGRFCTPSYASFRSGFSIGSGLFGDESSSTILFWRTAVKTAITFLGALVFWFLYFQFMDWFMMNKAQGLDYFFMFRGK
jgi:hypothetical protein